MRMGFQNSLSTLPIWSYRSKTTHWGPAPSPGVTGTLQEFMPVSDLERVDLNKTDLVVGKDNRLYSPRFGLLEGLAVKEPITDEAHVYIDRIDWESYPPLGELAYLFDIFFKKYDREVLMLVGRKRDHSGWVYHVPQQIGSTGLVRWTADDEEMGKFSDEAQWIGTIHIHPGSNCSPSQMDIDDWAEPEKSGLHLIFGRDGSFVIYGSIAGRTFKVWECRVINIVRSKAFYTTSRGRSLEVLLAKPRPPLQVKAQTRSRKVVSSALSDLDLEVITSQSPIHMGGSYIENHFHRRGIASIGHDELQSLRMVSHGDKYYILTEAQYACLEDLCRDVCSIPIAGNLSIRRIP